MPTRRPRESVLNRLQLALENAKRIAASAPQEIAVGAAENVLSGGTGLLSAVAAAPVAAAGALRLGDYRHYSPLFQAIVERGTYSPRTRTGQAIAGVAGNTQAAYSEGVRRAVENIPADMPLTRTAARVGGEILPAVVPVTPSVARRINAMPPTSALTRQAGAVNPRGVSGIARGKVEAMPADFTAYSEAPDDFVYHVTSAPNAKKILKRGFDPSMGGTTAGRGGAYGPHSRGRVFFTDKDGVEFWRERVEQHLFDQFDDPPDVVVLRVPKSEVGALSIDELGTRDANAAAYFLGRDK